MKERIRKIICKATDIVTIVFPAMMAVTAGLRMGGAMEWIEGAFGIVTMILGALASIASIVFNAVSKIRGRGEADG